MQVFSDFSLCLPPFHVKNNLFTGKKPGGCVSPSERRCCVVVVGARSLVAVCAARWHAALEAGEQRVWQFKEVTRAWQHYERETGAVRQWLTERDAEMGRLTSEADDALSREQQLHNAQVRRAPSFYNAYFSMRIFQCVFFNAYFSMHIFQCVFFNAYCSMRIFQCVFFKVFFNG